MTIYRISPRGLEFNISELPEGKLEIRLKGTSKLITVTMKLEEFSAAFYLWQMKGYAIQAAFNSLSAPEREFILTGITPTEWNEIFRETDSYQEYSNGFPKSDPRD